MFRLLLLLLPAALCASQPRYARLGEMDGKVDVQVHPADPWSPAERNLTLPENTWLRTATGARAEIELDEGSALRLGPDSLVELSDYARLSTGQRLTLLSLDRGVAYFTGEPVARDVLSLAVPGGQAMLSRGTRLRLEAAASFSRISVIEGVVKLVFAGADVDLHEGQSARIEPGNGSGFTLEREVAAMDLDRWSEERDKALANPASGARVPMRYGLADLDSNGQWLDTETGPVWKPNLDAYWVPFQKGRWRWYDSLGYTWVSDEPWGWLPYHYGRWSRPAGQGWVWTPPANPVFKPGDVYWLYNRQLTGWGPLAPGEAWSPAQQPQQFAGANTTYATLVFDAHVIDPASLPTRPKEPVAGTVFALALPSPALLPSRLEAKRPRLRVGATLAIDPTAPSAEPNPGPIPEPADIPTGPPDDPPPVVQPGVIPPPIMYPVPVYSDVVVVNPPSHPDYSRRNPNRPPAATPVPAPQTPTQPPAARPPVSRGSAATSPPQTNPSPAPKPGPPPLGRPPATPVPASAPTPVPVPVRVDPPRVGTPPPARTDRQRIESPPPKVDPAPPPAVPTKAGPKPEKPEAAKSDKSKQ